MGNKPVIYGVIGFLSGMIITILIGFFGMSAMMHGWVLGGCENYNYPEIPKNKS